MSTAKGFTTIRGKEPVLKTVLCAVEYDGGELYFDRMGRLARQLHAAGRGWFREPTVVANQTQLMNPADSLILSVSPSGAAVTLSTDRQPKGVGAEEITRFADQAAFALGVVTDELELPSFQRVGYREQYWFASASLEESEEWIRSLGLVRVEDSVFATFGRFYALSWAVVVAGEECRYRLELRGMERQASIPLGPAEVGIKHSRAKHLNRAELLQLLAAKRHRQLEPEYAAVLDIDAHLWDDTDPDFGLKDFVLRRAGENLNLFRQCLPK